MGLYYNGKKVRNLYYNGKCITRLALGKEMTRLVEGDDFVTAEWLKGDGTAYIDTNIIVNSSTLVLSIKSKAQSSGALCGSRNGANLNPDTTAIHYQSGRYRLDLLSVSNEYVWVNKSNLEDTFDIDLASNTAVVNGTSFTSSKTHTNSINTFRVFGCFGAGVGYSGYINKFMLDDSYNNLDLTPCRLLRPIPATLDGNGIARNAGECGMYDSVSGKFYGNVAASGTFTVSDN